MNKNRTKTHRMPLERRILEALTKRFALEPIDVFTLLGARYTSDDMLRLIAERIAAMEDVSLAHAGWLKAIAVEQAKESSTRDLFAAFRELLYLMYGSDPDVLVEIGLSPRRRPTTRSLEAKNEIVAKAKATRRARHTMGTRERLRITGEAGEAGAAGHAIEPEVQP